MFGQVVNIYTSSRTVHINFYNPNCKIDLVYKHQHEFNAERQEIINIRQISNTQHNAIKIVKYAFDTLVGNGIDGFEIENACFHISNTSLNEHVHALIRYFKGKLHYFGISIQDVMDFLQNQ